MTTEWAVVPLADKFTLDANNSGELKFTVSNPGDVPDTVVFDVVPGEGAQRSWFTVPEPQRQVPGHDAVEFLVRLTVPAGTAPASSDVVGLAYSANTAPEESSRRSGRVTFTWKPKEKPKPKWPLLVAAIVMVLIVASVVTWLALKDDGKVVVQPSASASPSPSAPPSPKPPFTYLVEAESLVSSANVSKKIAATDVVVQDNCCNVTWSGNNQMWFRGHAVDETVSVTFTVPYEGTFLLSTSRTRSYDYADTVWTVDGQLVGGTFAGYSPIVQKTSLFAVSTMKLAAGEHTLTLRVVGKNGASSGFYAGVDQIKINSGFFLNPDVVITAKLPILTK